MYNQYTINDLYIPRAITHMSTDTNKAKILVLN